MLGAGGGGERGEAMAVSETFWSQGHLVFFKVIQDPESFVDVLEMKTEEANS